MRWLGRRPLGLKPQSEEHPIAAHTEADDADDTEREDWGEAAVELRHLRASVATQKDRIGSESQENASKKVGDVMLLGEQRGNGD
jgi:hypothetical protein